VLYKKITRN